MLTRKWIVIFVTALVIVSSLAYGLQAAIAQEEYDPRAWEGTTIVVALDDRIENQRMQELIPEFEEATGIKVELDIMPENTLFDKTTLDLESGTGLYDVIQNDFMRVPKFGPGGQLLALDEFAADPTLSNPDWFSLDDFPEKYLDSLKADGKLYGLPLFCHVNVLQLRADVLEEKGLKPPETMEELEEVAAAIHDPDNDFYAIDYRGVSGQVANIWIWSGFLHTYGGDFFDEDWKPIFNSPAAVKATEMFVKLLQDYGPPGASTHHWAELQSGYLDGKIGMVWEVDVFRTRAEDPEISKVAGKLATYFVPYAEETGTRSTGLYTWGIMVPAEAKNKEAGWQFVQWWTSTDIGVQCEYPSTKGAIEQIYAKFDNPEGMPSFSEVILGSLEMSSPDYRPLIPEWNEIGDRIGIAVSEVLTEQKTAQEALDEAAANVEKIMEEAGYYQ